MMQTGGAVRAFLVIGIFLFLALVLVMPLAELFRTALTTRSGAMGLENFLNYIGTPHLIRSAWNSFFVSIVTVAITVPLALLFSYGITRSKMPGRRIFRTIGMITIFAPTLMIGISLIYLFGNNGLLTRIIPEMMGFAWAGKISIYGFWGIVAGEIFYTFPHAFLIIVVSLGGADNRLYDAAESLGAGTIRKFLTVTFPSIKYGLISACFIVFSLSFTDFGIPKVIGGNTNVLPTDVYKQIIGQNNMNMGAVVGVLLLIPAVVSFISDRILHRKRNAVVTAQAVPYRIRSDRFRDTVFLVISVLISAVMLLPVITVLVASLVKVWPYTPSFTLSHYVFDYVAGGGWTSLVKSIVLSSVSAVVGTLAVFFAAFVAEKLHVLPRLRQIVYMLSLLPMALPGIVVGLSFIFFFNRPEYFGVTNPFGFMYGTFGLLVLANIVHFFSVPFITASGTFRSIDREFDLVSESLGASLWKSFRSVTLPLSLGAVTETVFYFFVNSMATVSALIFLYTPDFMPASVAIVHMDDAGDTAAAAAMSVLILAVNIVFRVIYEAVHRMVNARVEFWKSGGAHDTDAPVGKRQ
jgi:iron(III) transport system permease protein